MPSEDENEIQTEQPIEEPVEKEPASSREAMERAVAAQKENSEPDKAEKPVNTGDNRQRDPQGRFANSPAEKVAAPLAPGQQAPQEAPQAARPPGSWSPEAKAAFGTLPPTVQAAIAKREAETENGFRVYQNYKGLEEFQPYMDRAGVSHAEVMRRALDWERATVNDPIGAARHLLQLRGVDPRLAAQALMNPNAPNPRIAPPQQPQIDVRGEVDRVFREREINSTVQQFLANPEHVHAELVSDHMAALIKQGVAKDLTEAYQMATWANPEIRATLIQRSQTQAPAGVRAAQAVQARSAAKAITGAPSRGNTPNGARQEPKDAREAMRMNVDAQLGR